MVDLTEKLLEVVYLATVFIIGRFPLRFSKPLLQTRAMPYTTCDQHWAPKQDGKTTKIQMCMANAEVCAGNTSASIIVLVALAFVLAVMALGLGVRQLLHVCQPSK